MAYFIRTKKTLGDNERWAEEQDLLNEALTMAKSRVVVKRPVNAPPLGTSSDEAGKNTIRLPSFDLMVCRTASSTELVSVVTKTDERRTLMCYPKSLSCYVARYTCLMFTFYHRRLF